MSRYKQQKPRNKTIQVCKSFYNFVKDTRQKHMRIPTDPKEIHRRADMIRAKIMYEREAQKERDRIKKDLELIEFDLLVRESQT